MNSPVETPDTLASAMCEIVRSVILELRPELIRAAVSGDHGEQRNVRHDDNFLSRHDMKTHQRYLELLRDELPSFVYASEEGEPRVVGDDPDPDLCVLVDPLDTSELAVRGLLGYTHLLVYSRRLRRPVAAVVGDMFHHLQLYVAYRQASGEDLAFILTADGERLPIKAQGATDLSEAVVTNFLMRPAERLIPLANQSGLMEALSRPGQDGKLRGRIGVDFGSVSLCHVAAGFTDAVLEFAKGFAVWDLWPGQYILSAAGGVVTDLDGNALPLDFGLDTIEDIHVAMDIRTKFIAAVTSQLAKQIADSLT